MNDDPLKIEAIVKFNGDQAYVFNRKPVFEYERVKNMLIAQDGPFFSSFNHNIDYYAKAFAGREFRLKLKSGGYEECSGQWWDADINDDHSLVHATYRTKDELINCYVFCGGQMIEDELNKLISEYEGCVYPYYEYETIICKKSDLRKRINKEIELGRQIRKLCRDKAHLIKRVKFISKQLKKTQ